MLRLIQHPLMYVCVLSALCSIGARVAECADQQKRALFSEKVVGHICSDGGAWLKCYRLPPSSCQSVALEFVTPCLSRYLAAADDLRDPAQAQATATQVIRCFEHQFFIAHDSTRTGQPECQGNLPFVK